MFHMGDGAGIMGLEASNNLESRGEDTNEAITTTNKKILRACTNAAEIFALASSANDYWPLLSMH